MFERFTDSARMAMAYANQAAQSDNSVVILPKHICLGVLWAAPNVASRLSQGADVNAESLMSALSSLQVPTDADHASADQRAAAKHAIEFAIAEARRAGAREVGAEHLILGLLRLDDPSLRQIFAEHGLALAAARQALRTGPTASPDSPGESV